MAAKASRATNDTRDIGGTIMGLILRARRVACLPVYPPAGGAGVELQTGSVL